RPELLFSLKRIAGPQRPARNMFTAQCSSSTTRLGGPASHGAACLLAEPALFGAVFHYGVILVRFAGLGALVTSIGAGSASDVDQRAVTRNDLRSHCAQGGTVVTHLHGLGVLSFAFAQQGHTMS